MVDRSALPVMDLYVRRRKSGQTTWLIKDNYYHEVDEALDALFITCDGTRTFAEIVDVLVARGLIEPKEANATVESALGQLHSLGLIQWK